MQSKVEKLREDFKNETGKILYNVDNYHKYLENLIIKNDEINFKRFMRMQSEAIKKYKWYRSKEENKDLGNACCQEWVEKFAKDFAKIYWGIK